MSAPSVKIKAAITRVIAITNRNPHLKHQLRNCFSVSLSMLRKNIFIISDTIDLIAYTLTLI